MKSLNRTLWTVAALLLINGVLITCASQGAWAAGDPFIGEWKLNSSMTRMPDEMKVESKGGNTYSFDFGAGQPETIVADGTDQPGVRGTTLSVKMEAPDTWIVVRKQNGKLLLRGTWKLSKDGTTLTDYYREFAPDGRSPGASMDYVYQRNGKESGFAADWQSIKETMNSPYVLQVKPYEGEGLLFNFISPSGQRTKTVKLDGKDYPAEGSNANSGASFSSRKVNDHTLEMVTKVGGTATDTREIKLSPDGKRLTMTVHYAGRSRPEVMVFDRGTGLPLPPHVM
jgi:hypothetical protein